MIIPWAKFDHTDIIRFRAKARTVYETDSRSWASNPRPNSLGVGKTENYYTVQFAAPTTAPSLHASLHFTVYIEF